MVPFYELEDIIKVLEPFQRAMSHDINEGKNMPVSRELYTETIKMINNWLLRPVYNSLVNFLEVAKV